MFTKPGEGEIHWEFRGLRCISWEGGIASLTLQIMTNTMSTHLQKTIHFLGDFRCQFGFGDRGGLTPPILRSHLHRWSDQGPEGERLYKPAGPMVGNRATTRERR